MGTGLSAWATKYGATTEVWSNPPGLRSGLTPISRVSFGPIQDANTKRQADDNELFQRQRLFNFTTQELIHLDIISQRAFRTSNIQAHIVPFWSRANWYDGGVAANGQTLQTYPLPAPYHDHRWVANDDVVWGLMQPILILASKILVENPRVTNFINNLIERDESFLDPERIPRWDAMRPDKKDELELTSITLRPFIGRGEDARMAGRRAAVFQELATCMTTVFKIDAEDTMTGDLWPAYRDNVEAATEGEFEEDTMNFKHVFTLLDCEMLVPLLGTQLNDAEKYGLITWAAMTLVHESIHALWHLLYAKTYTKYARIEPYIENDQLMEIGAAMEVRALGGFMKPMWNPRPGPVPPNFGFWVEPGFPKTFDIRRRHPSSAVLKMPKIPSQVLSIPIPVSIFEDIQSEEFWNVIMRSLDVPLFKLRMVQQVSKASQRRSGTAAVGLVTDFERTNIDDIAEAGRKAARKAAADAYFTGRQEFETVFGQLVTAAAALSPANRRTGEVSYSIKRSMEAIDQYWDSSQQLAALADSFAANGMLIAKIQNSLIVDATDGRMDNLMKLLLDQVNIVDQAITEHEGRILALEQTAVIRGSLDGELRAVLRAWNYDTRIFIREMGKQLKSIPAAQKQIEIMDTRLEVTRVRIWHYDEPLAVDSIENSEVVKLRGLWEERTQLRNVGKCIAPVIVKCDQLFNNRHVGHSLYYSLALRVMHAHCVAFSNDDTLYMGAKAHLEALNEPLARLRNAVWQPSHWIPVIEGWCNAATEAYQKMTLAQQGTIVATVVQDPLLSIGSYP